jgi:hypothetical protein
MGTNFYMRTKNIENYPEKIRSDESLSSKNFFGCIHIGKRSAAGMWCYDCGVTLCKDGIEGIHNGKSEWYKESDKFVCPKCGKEVKTHCSSWTWAVDPGDVFFKAELISGSNKKIVVNEYGDEITGDDFLIELEKVPIKFIHSVGVDFS